jgi:IS30 family transposase
MKDYRHLSLEEREKIYALKTAGKSLRSIAESLGRPHSTISRELGRNAKYGKPYIPCRADRLTKKRGEKQRYKAPLKCPLVFLYVREKLRNPKKRWSPETIAGRLPIDHPGYSVGVETIYRYVHHKKHRRYQLWQYLLRQHKKRTAWHGRKAKKMVIPASLLIANRPKVVEKRKKAGHWETDNMEGKRSDQTAVSVTVERTARLTHLAKLNDHTALTKTN